MNSSNYKFTHANGSVTPKRVDKIDNPDAKPRREGAAEEGALQPRSKPSYFIDFPERDRSVVLRNGGEVIRRSQNLRRDRVA